MFSVNIFTYPCVYVCRSVIGYVGVDLDKYACVQAHVCHFHVYIQYRYYSECLSILLAPAKVYTFIYSANYNRYTFSIVIMNIGYKKNLFWSRLSFTIMTSHCIFMYTSIHVCTYPLWVYVTMLYICNLTRKTVWLYLLPHLEHVKSL